MMGSAHRVSMFLALWLAVTAPAFDLAGEAAAPFVDCEELCATKPGSREASRCFFTEGSKHNLLEEAAGRLRAHLERRPEDPWLHFYLGLVGFRHRKPEVVSALRTAARLFADADEWDGEIWARMSLAHFFDILEEVEESEKELARAVELSASTRDPELLTRVRIHQARHSLQTGEDLRAAYRLLRQIEAEALEGSYELHRDWLTYCRRASYQLGRYREATTFARRLLEAARQENDGSTQADAAHGLVLTFVTGALPSESARRKALELAEESMAAARGGGNRAAELSTHRILGRLTGGLEGRRHLEKCIDIAKEIHEQAWVKYCGIALAGELAREDPALARRWLVLNPAAGQVSQDPFSILFDWIELKRVLWVTKPRTEVTREARLVLDSIETLRELQGSPAGRADLMVGWSELFYWLSGRLLESADEPSPDDVRQAFVLVEQQRARVVLERLTEARASVPAPSESPYFDELTELLNRKAAAHRRLAESRFKDLAVDSELEALHFDEEELRQKIAQNHPPYFMVRPPAFASLKDVEKSLADDEAMLSFQVALWEDIYRDFGGGSWLLVSTREDTHVYRLPDRVVLEPMIKALRAFDNPDESPELLVNLYHKLLGEALSELPARIKRLVIVPDGQLHLLPFGALRSDTDIASSLIHRFQLSRAPSATLWLRWRNAEPTPAKLPALILADPVLAKPREVGPGTSDGLVERGESLEPLRHARKEGRAIVRHLGRMSDLWIGEEASERSLKDLDLQSYGVLHLAAHAVVDSETPQRSAVFLAPGSDEEDGWLQPSEIVERDLTDRLVVLSTCESAAGQVLRGEGVMSLARAFFQAGARTVVASLWRLPDAETAALSEAFYRSLSQGQSVSGALAAAQRERIAKGAPVKAWAGLVVLGDGSLTPFPGGLQHSGKAPRTSVTILVGLLVLAAIFWLWRRRSVA